MNGEQGFLGFSSALYSRVWFDTQNRSQTLFNGSKRDAQCRFEEIKAHLLDTNSSTALGPNTTIPTYVTEFPQAVGTPVTQAATLPAANGDQAELHEAQSEIGSFRTDDDGQNELI